MPVAGYFEGPGELDSRHLARHAQARLLAHAAARGMNATIMRKVVPEEIQRLEQQPGGDMVVGGANPAATLARYGLIDEYRVCLQPVVLGAGRPLFQPSEARLPFRMIEWHRFGNGVVLRN